MVQTEEQYVFVHDALMDYIESSGTEIDVNQLSEYIRSKSEIDRSGELIGFLEFWYSISQLEMLGFHLEYL